MTPDSLFWDGKKVLITGASGFKGSWLGIWLYKLGANIIPCDLNVCDYGTLFYYINEYKPEIVFHLAAVSTIQEAMSEPGKAIAVNAAGTCNLLDALDKVGCAKAIINVTTDKVYYPIQFDCGYTEKDIIGGMDIYSISKVCSEYISRVYRWTYKMPVATARAGNVIGGGDFKSTRLVPAYYNAWKNGTKMEVVKDAIRPWQYVLDALCGYIILAEKLYENSTYVGAWNFASNEYDLRTAQWIIDELNKYFDPKVEYDLIDNRDYYETKQLMISSKKSRDALGWEPRYKMEDMIESTALWYKEYNGNNFYDLVSHEIFNYDGR
jgi:CDP-glucose 4,6-dehydratase